MIVLGIVQIFVHFTLSYFSCSFIVNTVHVFYSQLNFIFSEHNGLPTGKGGNCWALYKSDGPYLTSVTIELDPKIVIINKPVTIEITVKRDSVENVTKGNEPIALQ